MYAFKSIFVASLATVLITDSLTGQDVQSTIEVIERMPRSRRLVAYPEAIHQRGITSADRVALTREFAKHAKRVSPHYLNTRNGSSLRSWVTILESGFQADPDDVDIAWALAQIFINDKQYSKALPAVESIQRLHPNHRHALAWQRLCDSTRDGRVMRPDKDEIRSFPLHFCVLTRNPSAHPVATIERCRQACTALNQTFRTHDGDALVEFTFEGLSQFSEVQSSASKMTKFGDSREPYDAGRVADAYDECKESLIRDQDAINVFVFDSFSPASKYGDITSHGARNSNRPFVLLDWQHLAKRTESNFAHVMGHCFGLDDVGVPRAVENSLTNIMASSSEQFGNQGDRSFGFTEAQAAVILYHAKRTQQKLGFAK